MIKYKSKEEIETLKEGGRRLFDILTYLKSRVSPGVTARELDDIAREMVLKNGDKPAFLNYKPYGADRPYPASLCVSVNDEIVHGIPNEKEKILKEGDIVSLDMGIIHKGLITDSAITVPVGNIDDYAKKLIAVTEEALYSGIKKALISNHVGDISKAIQDVIKPHGFGIVEGLSGHGVGYKVHEDPYIPNYYRGDKGDILKEGMVIAIEPMVNEGSKEIFLDEDGYTYKTKDGKRSAHFEHTIAITKEGPIILTK